MAEPGTGGCHRSGCCRDGCRWHHAWDGIATGNEEKEVVAKSVQRGVTRRPNAALAGCQSPLGNTEALAVIFRRGDMV